MAVPICNRKDWSAMTHGKLDYSRFSIWIISACIGLLTWTSCSAKHPPSPPGNNLAKTPENPDTSAVLIPSNGNLPSLADLDNLQPIAIPVTDTGSNRAPAAAPVSKQFPGSQVLARSSHVVLADDGTATLASAPGEMEYCIYEAYNCSARCTQFSPNLTFIESDCYIAIADYQTGRWQLQGPYDQTSLPSQFAMGDDRYFSPLRRQYWAVIVVNGAQLRVETYDVEIDVPDLLPKPVSLTATYGAELLDLGGLPGIAYVADSGGNLATAFSMAKGSAPQDETDWFHSVVDIDNPARYMSATVHQGRAVVLYAGYDETMWLARAKVVQPKLDTDWEKIELTDGRDCRNLSIVSDGQRIHYALYEGDFADADTDLFYSYLNYGHSDSADALGSYTTYRVSTLGNMLGTEVTEPSIAIIDATPAIAITSYKPVTFGRVQYSHTTSALPDAAVDWTSHLIDNYSNLVGISLREHNGRPLILYSGSVPGLYLGKVLRPLETLDWGYEPAFAADSHGPLDLLIYNGRLIFTFPYTSPDPNYLQIHMCAPLLNPATGLTKQLGARVYPPNILSNGDMDPSLASVGGRPAMAYCDQDAYIMYYSRIAN
jgi:hypothetical protein